MLACAFTASPWNKVLVFSAFGNTDLSCSYIRNTSIYPSLSPDIISCWTEKDKLSHFPFLWKNKKSYQSRKMSTTGQVLPWLPPPTQRKLTNVRPSITSRWPFQNWGSQKHTFHLLKEDEKGGNGENQQCHLQYITFTKWSSHHATLPHSKDKHWIWMKSLWLPTHPPLHPHGCTHTHTQRYRFCSFFPDDWTWVNGRLHTAAAESHKASPQKTCECSEVESKSICSCTRPSVPQIHPFHLHYHLHRPVPMTG